MQTTRLNQLVNLSRNLSTEFWRASSDKTAEGKIFKDLANKFSTITEQLDTVIVMRQADEPATSSDEDTAE